ncbi:MAG: hypothetical protein GC166_15020 [Alphaproteobacteria bacterium]|nr:hypothetical protein [Alphaproteobacteria bacterium]
MNINLKNHPKLIGFVVAAALSLGANTAAWASEYKFQTVHCMSGDALAVRVVDETTGQPVNNAQVFVVHRQWLPGKGEPRYLDHRVALTPDGKGDFTYEGSDVQAGATIKLVAQIDGSEIPGTAGI